MREKVNRTVRRKTRTTIKKDKSKKRQEQESKVATTHENKKTHCIDLRLFSTWGNVWDTEAGSVAKASILSLTSASKLETRCRIACSWARFARSTGVSFRFIWDSIHFEFGGWQSEFFQRGPHFLVRICDGLRQVGQGGRGTGKEQEENSFRQQELQWKNTPLTLPASARARANHAL